MVLFFYIHGAAITKSELRTFGIGIHDHLAIIKFRPHRSMRTATPSLRTTTPLLRTATPSLRTEFLAILNIHTGLLLLVS